MVGYHNAKIGPPVKQFAKFMLEPNALAGEVNKAAQMALFDEIIEAFEMVEVFLKEKKRKTTFLCGNQVSAADVFIASDYLLFTTLMKKEPKSMPRIEKWFE